MNPNSQNQRWSAWVFTVRAPFSIPFEEMRDNCAKFGRKAFRSTSQMDVRQNGRTYTIEIHTEGHMENDLMYREWMKRQWTAFFVARFGTSVIVDLEARLLAGSRDDGTPPDQWIGIPSVKADVVLWGQHG